MVAAALVAAGIAGGGLLAPGVASADDPDSAPTAISAKYDALGGATGVLGSATGALTCDDDLYPGDCQQAYEHGVISWIHYRGTYAITDAAVLVRWAADGGGQAAASVGLPITDTFCGLRGGGCGQHFERGSIYWSPEAGRALRIDQYVDSVWAEQGWEHGPLGFPVSEESCTLRDDGCIQHFAGGSIYTDPSRWMVRSVVAGAVADRWAAQGWENGPLGYPSSSAFCGLRDGGCGQHFQGGSIYSSPAGAFVVSGALYSAWAAQGWEAGLGYPLGEAFGTQSFGTGQHFQRGSVYTSYGQTLVVPGAIRDHWGALGWERAPLGDPVSPVFCGLRDGGCGQHFLGGTIYSSPAGAFAVMNGLAWNRWAAQGFEAGPLGYPTSDWFKGQYTYGQHFQGGSIYTGNSTPYVIPSSFMGVYAAQGWERGYLGSPSSETFCGLRDGGCGQHFQGGSIYSSPWGSFAVPRSFRDQWAAAGWEGGSLGYPTSAVFCGLRGGGCGQHFQGGSIYSAAPVDRSPLIAPQAYAVTGAIRDAWAARGWENGPLGYPASSAYPVPGGLLQQFTGGSIAVVNGRVTAG